MFFHWIPTIDVDSGGVYFHQDGFDWAEATEAATKKRTGSNFILLHRKYRATMLAPGSFCWIQ
jgi:hypothetical protein